MSEQYPFPLPEAIQEKLQGWTKERPIPPAWEKYGFDAHFNPAILAFYDNWLQRTKSRLKTIDLVFERTDDDDDMKMELLYLLDDLKAAFAELEELETWATVAWPYDPTIKAHFNGKGNGGNGQMEEGDPWIFEVDENAVCTHFPGPGEFAVNVM